VQAGPGAWSANQTWAADSVNGGNLTGYFYWPSTKPTLAGKRALVLVLHGCAQTASGDVIDSTSDKGFNWKGVADQYGAVILAPNATGNVYGSHCWDYSRTNHSRTTGHEGVLLDLIKRFVSNSQYAIDPKQVYVAGLSSGGGETMVLACLAPDIFAGVGINAGPPPGTTTLQIGSVPSGYTATTAANNCKALAGTTASPFSTQIAGVIWGTSDYTVSQQYGPLDAQAMRMAYGGTYTKGSRHRRHRRQQRPLHGRQWQAAHQRDHGHRHGPRLAGRHGRPEQQLRRRHPRQLPVLRDGFLVQEQPARRARGGADVNSCSASVSGSTATISGTGSDQRHDLQLPRDPERSDAGQRRRRRQRRQLQQGLRGLANGYYTGSVTALDSRHRPDVQRLQHRPVPGRHRARAAATRRPGGRQPARPTA
jgi:poly(3-hydroxybutyrate) depolymerase